MLTKTLFQDLFEDLPVVEDLDKSCLYPVSFRTFVGFSRLPGYVVRHDSILLQPFWRYWFLKKYPNAGLLVEEIGKPYYHLGLVTKINNYTAKRGE